MARASDITVTVSLDAFPARTVVSVEVADGSEAARADVVRLVVAHLDALWTELADDVEAAGHQVIHIRPGSSRHRLRMRR
jgi:hypothetical protein